MIGLRSISLYVQPSTNLNRSQVAVEFIGENEGIRLTKIYPHSTAFLPLQAYDEIKRWILDGELC